MFRTRKSLLSPEETLFRTRKSLLSPEKTLFHTRKSLLPPKKLCSTRESLFSPPKKLCSTRESSHFSTFFLQRCHAPAQTPRKNLEFLLRSPHFCSSSHTSFVSIGSTHILWNIVPPIFLLSSSHRLLRYIFLIVLHQKAARGRRNPSHISREAE